MSKLSWRAFGFLVLAVSTNQSPAQPASPESEIAVILYDGMPDPNAPGQTIDYRNRVSGGLFESGVVSGANGMLALSPRGIAQAYEAGVPLVGPAQSLVPATYYFKFARMLRDGQLIAALPVVDLDDGLEKDSLVVFDGVEWDVIALGGVEIADGYAFKEFRTGVSGIVGNRDYAAFYAVVENAGGSERDAVFRWSEGLGLELVAVEDGMLPGRFGPAHVQALDDRSVQITKSGLVYFVADVIESRPDTPSGSFRYDGIFEWEQGTELIFYENSIHLDADIPQDDDELLGFCEQIYKYATNDSGDLYVLAKFGFIVDTRWEIRDREGNSLIAEYEPFPGLGSDSRIKYIKEPVLSEDGTLWFFAVNDPIGEDSESYLFRARRGSAEAVIGGHDDAFAYIDPVCGAEMSFDSWSNGLALNETGDALVRIRMDGCGTSSKTSFWTFDRNTDRPRLIVVEDQEFIDPADGSLGRLSGSLRYNVGSSASGAASNFDADGSFVISNPWGLFLVGTGGISVEAIDMSAVPLSEATDPPPFEGGVERYGLTADGTSRLVLRTRKSSEPGFVRITVADETGSTRHLDAGLLSPLDSWADNASPPVEFDNPVTVPLVEDDEGRYQGFAALIAPENFVRNHRDQTGIAEPDRLRGLHKPRELTVVVERLDEQGDPTGVMTYSTLELHRPPVVLVHGYMSSPEAWNWTIENDPRFMVELEDYYETNTTGFFDNVRRERVPAKAIAKANGRMQEMGIASTQADVIGHSMGGVLTRLYVSDQTPAGVVPEAPEYAGSLYRRADNFLEGDVNKFVALHSPMLGSPITSLIATLDNELTWSAWVVEGMGWANGNQQCIPCPGRRPPVNPLAAGAARDLRVDSPAIRSLNSVPAYVPTHAIVGVPDVDLSTSCYAETARLDYALACGLDVLEFFSGPNDAAVSGRSQAGLLDIVCPSAVTVHSGDEALHGPVFSGLNCEPPSVPGSGERRVIELLNSDVRGSEFCANGFPVNGAIEPDVPEGCSSSLGAWCAEQVQVANDAEPGESLWVDFQIALCNASSSAVTGILISAPGIAPVVILDALETSGIVSVPDWYVGDLPLRIAVLDDAGGVTVSEPAVVRVESQSPVISILGVPEQLTLDMLSQTYAISPWGLFGDGVERYIGIPGAGTTYTALDPSIVSVDSTGLLVAKGIGKATVIVQHGLASSEIRVCVHYAMGDYDRDGVVGPLDLAAFNACYTGALESADQLPTLNCQLSFDFDGDGDVDCVDTARFLDRWNHPDEPVQDGPCGCLADFDANGDLDFDDVLAFLVGYGSMDPVSDLAPPIGTFDFDDILAFLTAFGDGCP